jgi:hypothetical protein
MGSILQFIGQILTGPMLIVLTSAPQSGPGYIVNQAVKGHPNLWLVLTVSKGKM